VAKASLIKSSQGLIWLWYFTTGLHPWLYSVAPLELKSGTPEACNAWMLDILLLHPAAVSPQCKTNNTEAVSGRSPTGED